MTIVLTANFVIILIRLYEL